MVFSFKLGRKFLAFYAMPILLSGVSAIAVYTTTNQVTKLAETVQAEQETFQTVNEMIYGLSRMARNVRGKALFPKDASYRKSYDEGFAVFQEKGSWLEATVQDPPQRQRVLAMIAEGKRHHQYATEVFNLFDRNQVQQAIVQVPRIRMAVVDQNYQDFQRHHEQQLATYNQNLKSALLNLKILVLFSTCLGVAFAAGVGYLISKRLKQAQRIEQQSWEIAEKNQQLQQKQIELTQSFKELETAQSQLVQAEKMSSLGQLVAGVAHEINNPVNFIHGNLAYVQAYALDLMHLVQLYQAAYPDPLPEIETEAEDIDLEFLQQDLPKMLDSMKVGTDRIRHIVLSLRNFSRTDEAGCKAVNIHEGIDSTLLILQHRLKARPERPEIQVLREYGDLPLVECQAGQLNQVFMNILANAIDALDEVNEKRTYEENQANPSKITIHTSVLNAEWVEIAIMDNGPGIPQDVQERIFDPFFTTKPIGKGTGMGMSISYQVITEKHGGKLECMSSPGGGAKFIIQMPVCQKVPVVG